MRSAGTRRVVRLVVALWMASWVMAVSGAPPGAAQEPPEEPAVRVTPSSGLREGDVVDVELTGFAGMPVAVTLCPASILDRPELPFPTLACTGRLSDIKHAEVTTSPAVVEGLPIREWLSGPSTRDHCGARPGACVVLAHSSRLGEPPRLVAAAPVDVVASPLTVYPVSGVAGTTIEATVGGEPRAQVTVAQCAQPVGDSLASSLCGPGTPVTLDEYGVATVDVVLAQALETPSGSQSCVSRPGSLRCAIATFGATGEALTSQGIGVTATDPIQVATTPQRLDALADGQEIEVVVTGRAEIPVRVAECRTGSWDRDVENGPCQVLAELHPAAPGTNVRTAGVVVHEQFTGADGTAVTCRESGDSTCLLVVEADDGAEFRSRRMLFPTVRVLPWFDLVDGQTMTIDSRALGDIVGPAEVALVRCQELAGTPVEGRVLAFELEPDRCEDPETAPRSRVVPGETWSATFPAAQRFQAVSGAYRYCAAYCLVGLYVPDRPAEERLLVVGRYEMANGGIELTPASGLQDGQAVTVTGSQLMSSYDGPPVGFLPSGQWSLSQCGSGALNDPSVFSIFAGCTPLAPGPVLVPGSELSAAVNVRARFTSMLGQPVDCTPSVFSCVVLLARLEQDGSISTHSVYIGFGA